MFPRLRYLLVASIVSLGQLAYAQDFDIEWRTIDGGGTSSSAGGSFTLSGTVGQSDAGPDFQGLIGGTFSLEGRFLPVTQICFCPGDMNQDGSKNGDDIQTFVNCFITGGNCSCADVNGTNGMDVGDVTLFVADLLAGDICP